jgi:hypothetical protein
MGLISGPRLTIVATSRNDNHGGDLNTRMRLFLDTLYQLGVRHGLACEVCVVEWNPPLDRPPLAEVLPKPLDGSSTALRIITVPPVHHAALHGPLALPVHQMIAKNIGIRRATADWVLATNVDVLFSEALYRHLKHQLEDNLLDPNRYYRANLCNIPYDPTLEQPLDQRLAWAAQHVISREGRLVNHPHIEAHLEFYRRNPLLATFINLGSAVKRRVFHSAAFRAVHTADLNACGDFTLMHRSAWAAIKGYVEAPVFPLHIDSLALLAALALGYRQQVLPPHQCLYHIEHGGNWALKNPADKLRYLLKRPAIDTYFLRPAAVWMHKHREEIGYNSPTWGYEGETFAEQVWYP